MSKHAFFAIAAALPAALVVAGCVAPQHEVHGSAMTLGQCGVVFAVDGAGGFEATSTSLRQAINEAGLPLGVEPVEWSHGYGRILADQVDSAHAQEEGQRLAGRIAALRQSRPEGKIYLVGHSAGSAVALIAAEALPPDTVDGIVLLAPSVSADYDLRPALRTSLTGIDVFFSSRDVGWLGMGVGLVGTADRRWFTAAAGRVGFRPVLETPEDAALYARLRQHPWSPCVEWTGNHGGHYGGYQVEYLHAYVLPLLTVRTGV